MAWAVSWDLYGLDFKVFMIGWMSRLCVVVKVCVLM